MAKLSLLQIVQEILGAIDSDVVNAIADTEEATQAAQIVGRVFREITANQNWPHQKVSFNLTGLGDSQLPNYLSLPENIKELNVFNYNKRKDTDTRDKQGEIFFRPVEDFLRFQNLLDSSDADVKIITDPSGIQYNVRTDQAPSHWTSFDDNLIATNQFDVAVDTTLQTVKTQCWGYRNSTPLVLADTSIPDIPEAMFSFLVSECISVASNDLRQAANNKAEQASNRQRIQMAQKS